MILMSRILLFPLQPADSRLEYKRCNNQLSMLVTDLNNAVSFVLLLLNVLLILLSICPSLATFLLPPSLFLILSISLHLNVPACSSLPTRRKWKSGKIDFVVNCDFSLLHLAFGYLVMQMKSSILSKLCLSYTLKKYCKPTYCTSLTFWLIFIYLAISLVVMFLKHDIP